MVETDSQPRARDITGRENIIGSEQPPECLEGQWALDALRDSEKRYRALLDGLDAIVWQVDLPEAAAAHEQAPLLPFSFVSQQAEPVLGYPAEQWLSEPNFWINHIHPDDRERMLAHCRGATHEPHEHEMEYRMLAADGRVVWVQDRVRLVRGDDGRPRQMYGLIEDITERKQAEETLRASEERFRALVENASDGIVLLAQDGTILYASPINRRVFGWNPGQVLGSTWMVRVHPDDLEACTAQFLNAIEHPTELVAAEARVRATHGSWRWVEGTARNLLGHPSVRAIVVNSRDITERKQAEEDLNRSREQLRALSARLQRVREEERTRIAREIHDELGQTLTGLKMDLAWLRKRLARVRLPAETREKVASMSHLMDTTIQAVRRICSDLRPALLDDFGLAAAIEWQAQDFQARTGIRCEFTSGLAQDAVIDRDGSTALFRILQESLTNVARHAHATHVRIALQQRAGDLILEVADDGSGITETEGLDPKSLGLLGIRERARLLGGQVTIVGAPARGTTVTVCLPGGHR